MSTEPANTHTRLSNSSLRVLAIDKAATSTYTPMSLLSAVFMRSVPFFGIPLIDSMTEIESKHPCLCVQRKFKDCTCFATRSGICCLFALRELPDLAVVEILNQWRGDPKRKEQIEKFEKREQETSKRVQAALHRKALLGLKSKRIPPKQEVDLQIKQSIAKFKKNLLSKESALKWAKDHPKEVVWNQTLHDLTSQKYGVCSCLESNNAVIETFIKKQTDTVWNAAERSDVRKGKSALLEAMDEELGAQEKTFRAMLQKIDAFPHLRPIYNHTDNKVVFMKIEKPCVFNPKFFKGPSAEHMKTCLTGKFVLTSDGRIFPLDFFVNNFSRTSSLSERDITWVVVMKNPCELPSNHPDNF